MKMVKTFNKDSTIAYDASKPENKRNIQSKIIMSITDVIG